MLCIYCPPWFMDNSPNQKDKIKTAHRLQFFERLSRPKPASSSRARDKLFKEDALVIRRKDGGSHTVQRNYVQSETRRKPNIMEQVRSILFNDSGAPPNSSMQMPQTPATPQPSAHHRSTPKSEISSRKSQPNLRPSTPSMQNRSVTSRSRSKTPELRRKGMLSRQEKVKPQDELKKMPEPMDKESRMLLEFEKELEKNQKILAASGNLVEETGNRNETDEDRTEYDYNGRRIRKKPLQSKSSSHIRSKSAPRLNKAPMRNYERSYERDDSMPDSEDFEVAMAMSSGTKSNDAISQRSKSVDDFLDERGPKPRKEKHESRKSRIPTPVHFNSGRKSATGVPYHDSHSSKSAIRSNVEGVGSHELHPSTQNRGQRSLERTRGVKEHSDHMTEKQRKVGEIERREQAHGRKENIRPLSPASRMANAEEYDIDNLELFMFGRHGNKRDKSPRKNAENSSGNGSKHRNDFVDGRRQYFYTEDVTARYVDNYSVPNSRDYNSNSNNNSNRIGQSVDESEESIRHRHKKNGYHRCNLHSSAADLLKSDPSANQIHSREKELSNQRFLQQSSKPQDFSVARGQQQQLPTEHPSVGVNSGIKVGATQYPSWGTKSSLTQPVPQVTGSNHAILETTAGRYHYIVPGSPKPASHQQQNAYYHEPTSTRERNQQAKPHNDQKYPGQHHNQKAATYDRSNYQALGPDRSPTSLAPPIHESQSYYRDHMTSTYDHSDYKPSGNANGLGQSPVAPASEAQNFQRQSQNFPKSNAYDKLNYQSLGRKYQSNGPNQFPAHAATTNPFPRNTQGAHEFSHVPRNQSGHQLPGNSYQAYAVDQFPISHCEASLPGKAPDTRRASSTHNQSRNQAPGNNFQVSGSDQCQASQSETTPNACSSSTPETHQSFFSTRNQSNNQVPGDSYQADGSNRSLASYTSTTNACSNNESRDQQTFVSGVEDTKPRDQPQNSPIGEQEKHKTNQEKEFVSEPSSSRNSRRRNFNYFFSESYLKDVIRKKNTQPADLVTDEQTQRSKDERSPVLDRNFGTRPHSSKGDPPQYSSPPKYKESACWEDQVHFRSDSNNNSGSYPNRVKEQYQRDNYSLQEHTTRTKTRENYKLDASSTEYYTRLLSSSDQTPKFQFPTEAGKAEYV